jgi:arylsulfatase A-like enzyme
MKANILSLLALTLALTAFAEKRPNIVWIFSDDHTNQAIGAYGGPLAALDPTPNIDRLSAEGMRFDHCYVGNSICAPARATLLTGKHSHITDRNLLFGGVAAGGEG